MAALESKSVVSALDGLFLRLYAKNLLRSYRNDPASACTDTEIQMSTIILLAIGGCVMIIGALVAPGLLRKLFAGGTVPVAAVLVMTVAVVNVVHRRFVRFERAPEMSLVFQTPQHTRTATLIFWGVAVGWLVIMIVTLR
jgi:hypothetical protein